MVEILMVKINLKEQSKFSEHQYKLWIEKPDNDIRETNYNEIEKALKDFLFIKSELANYSYLYASQLAFEKHLNLPYWDYLFIKGEINEELKNELEEGALLIIYLLYIQVLEAEGYCKIANDNLSKQVEKLLSHYTPNDYKKERLYESINLVMKNYENDRLVYILPEKLSLEEKDILKKITENDNWILKEIVQNYFINKVNSFINIEEKTQELINNLLNKS